jgi:hypothetical protein
MCKLPFARFFRNDNNKRIPGTSGEFYALLEVVPELNAQHVVISPLLGATVQPRWAAVRAILRAGRVS